MWGSRGPPQKTITPASPAIMMRSLECLTSGRNRFPASHGSFKAEVHVPSLTSIDLSGASRAVIDTGFVSTQPLAVTLSGASRVDAVGVTCSAITTVILSCAGSSVGVVLSGASTATVGVGSGNLSVSASGASSLYCGGGANVNDLSGGSVIVKLELCGAFPPRFQEESGFLRTFQDFSVSGVPPRIVGSSCHMSAKEKEASQ